MLWFISWACGHELVRWSTACRHKLAGYSTCHLFMLDIVAAWRCEGPTHCVCRSLAAGHHWQHSAPFRLPCPSTPWHMVPLNPCKHSIWRTSLQFKYGTNLKPGQTILQLGTTLNYGQTILSTTSNFVLHHTSQAKAIRSTPTLPKRLMPLSLSSLKLWLYRLVTGAGPATAASSAAAGGLLAGRCA